MTRKITLSECKVPRNNLSPSCAKRCKLRATGYEPKPAVQESEFNTCPWGKPMSLHGVRLWSLGETMPDFKKLETLSKWLGVPVLQLAYGGKTAHAAELRRTRWDSGPRRVRCVFKVARAPTPVDPRDHPHLCQGAWRRITHFGMTL